MVQLRRSCSRLSPGHPRASKVGCPLYTYDARLMALATCHIPQCCISALFHFLACCLGVLLQCMEYWATRKGEASAVAVFTLAPCQLNTRTETWYVDWACLVICLASARCPAYHITSLEVV